ncbi:MAG: stage II sporulation protein M [Verrucomicrobiota bacterium]
MILDLNQFIAKEQPYWNELTSLLERQDESPDLKMSMDEVKRFHYLYQRASSDLVKLQTFAGEQETASYLESLVARAYSNLHERRAKSIPFRPWHFLGQTIPQAFRRHWLAFVISIGTFILGGAFGAGVLQYDYGLKREFIPPQFGHLYGSPSERVEKEESDNFDHFESRHTFSASLMRNNISVTIKAAVFGILFGVITIILLFYNGVIIGVVMYDYIRDGQGEFLAAWLLPHGSFELPAIFIGGQVGLVIAHAVFGWGTNLRFRQRLASIRGDILALLAGAAIMLVWAGITESFLSQYHRPWFYPWKIGFGVIELGFLIWYFGFCGRKKSPKQG